MTAASVVAAAPLLDAAKTSESVKAGPIGLAVILLLCVASYFLFKSMSKHMRNVRENFPSDGVDPGDGSQRPGQPQRPERPVRPTRQSVQAQLLAEQRAADERRRIDAERLEAQLGAERPDPSRSADDGR